MSAKQRRTTGRFLVQMMGKLAALIENHVEMWEKDDSVTKEQILKEFKTLIKESKVLK